MRLTDPLVACTMAPLGIALGVGGFIALELAYLGVWFAGGLLILGLIAIDTRGEAGRPAPLMNLIDRMNIRSRRARRAARNLFCGSFITGVLACMMFLPDRLI